MRGLVHRGHAVHARPSFWGLGAAWCWLARAANGPSPRPTRTASASWPSGDGGALPLAQSAGGPPAKTTCAVAEAGRRGGVEGRRGGESGFCQRSGIWSIVPLAVCCGAGGARRRSRRRPILLCVLRSSAFWLRFDAAVLARSEDGGRLCKVTKNNGSPARRADAEMALCRSAGGLI